MNIQSFFITILTALALENPVFARALGLNRWTQNHTSVKDIFLYGGIFTWVLFFSTLGNYAVIQLTDDKPYIRYILALLFLVIVFLVYVATYFLIKKFLPNWSSAFLKILPVITFNTTSFSVFYIILYRDYSLASSIAYTIGTGLGYTVALIIIFYAKKRLQLSNIPRSFRGTPILLVYIGLLALGLYGLLGYGVSA